MASETTTPNIGLQVAAFDQPNWQVPTNYNWALLDKIFGGEVTVPALSVENFTIENIGSVIAGVFMAEVPGGAVPGNTFTLSETPAAVVGFFVNGLIQRAGFDYTLSGAVVTLMQATTAGDTVWAVYFKL